jgi:RNA polymerase sigma factor (TIGR02999 family)
MNEVTRILSAIDGGDPLAARRLLPLVYEELRKLAAQRLAREKPGQTLQATSLVHEAYLRLVGAAADADAPPQQQFSGRAHFFAAAAEAMRRVVVDNARRKQAEKHGGGRRRVDLDDSLAAAVAPPPAATAAEDLLALDQALEKLEREDKTKSDLVKLHYFTGLSLEEAADALAMSRATAYRYWTYARAWLGHEVRRCKF